MHAGADAHFLVNIEDRLKDVAQIETKSQMHGRLGLQFQLGANLDVQQVGRIESEPLVELQIGDVQVQTVHLRHEIFEMEIKVERRVGVGHRNDIFSRHGSIDISEEVFDLLVELFLQTRRCYRRVTRTV